MFLGNLPKMSFFRKNNYLYYTMLTHFFHTIVTLTFRMKNVIITINEERKRNSGARRSGEPEALRLLAELPDDCPE